MNSSIDIIEALFGGHGRVAVLRLLTDRQTPLTGRQVSELTGLSQAGAARTLQHLASLGVVSRRRIGRAVTHVLVRDNLLVETIVLPVIRAEHEIAEELKRDLALTFAGVAVSVVLFGSVARGEATAGSDIDVLLVVRDPADATEADAIADREGPRFFRRYGMALSVVIVSVSRPPKAGEAFWARVLEEGVTVSGRSLDEVMMNGSGR